MANSVQLTKSQGEQFIKDFRKVFKDISPAPGCYILDTHTADHSVWTRSGKPEQVATGKVSVHISHPSYRFDDGYIVFQATKDFVKIFCDTMAEKGIIQPGQISQKKGKTAVSYDDNTETLQIVDLNFKTNDVAKIAQAFDVAAERVRHKLDETKKAQKLLSTALDPKIKFMPQEGINPGSNYLMTTGNVFLEMHYGNPAERRVVQGLLSRLGTLEREKGIGTEDFAYERVISLKDLGQLDTSCGKLKMDKKTGATHSKA